MRASGKTIVVTGGGNGIGRQLVLQLLERGAKIAAIDISEEGLAETTKLAGAKASSLSTHVANITDKAVVEALPDAVIAAHGQVDGLINCAGIIQPFVKFNELEYSAIERVMNVNFWGLTYMTKTFLPLLLTRPEAHVVNFSSMGGFLPVPGQTIYGASKAAVKLMTEGLHSELTETGVKVTVVFPGAIATDIAANSGLDMHLAEGADAPKHKTTSAVEAARVVIEGMESNSYRVLIGGDAKMMDRLCRLMPERAAAIIYNQMKDLLG
ncbi:MAG TPA: SDR family oxidoreductase [Coriobacteriia bacterium]|nr:SDR family oxidoreductase [Coriobacteriia bacterium]